MAADSMRRGRHSGATGRRLGEFLLSSSSSYMASTGSNTALIPADLSSWLARSRSLTHSLQPLVPLFLGVSSTCSCDHAFWFAVFVCPPPTQPCRT
eukprot:6074564-Pleurochrysis_carterae.AAC.1